MTTSYLTVGKKGESAMSRRWLRASLAFSLVLVFELGATRANAATDTPDIFDLPLEELMQVEEPTVYSASKHAELATRAPASVTVITAADIKRFGYRNLGDILRSVRGIFLSNDRNYTYLGMRGFFVPGDYQTRILLLLNGNRLNDPVYSSFYLDQDFVLDVDLIDRIEIVRGATSSLYGTNALLGTINVITKQGRHIGPLETSAAASRYDTYSGRLTWGDNFSEEDIESLVSGSFYDSNGVPHLSYPELNDSTGSNSLSNFNDAEEAEKFFSNVRWKHLTLNMAHSSRDKDLPTGSYGSILNSHSNETTDESTQIGLNYQDDLSEEWRIDGRVVYDYYSYQGSYAYDYSEAGDLSQIVLNQDDVSGDRATTTWQFDRRLAQGGTLSFGVEHEQLFSAKQKNFDVKPYLEYLNDDHSSWRSALFTQFDQLILERLKISTGVRCDYYETFGSALAPRVGLIFDPWDNTFFKTIYGRSFRAPNAYELYYDSPTDRGNPNLDAETIDSFEFAWEQLLGKHSSFTVAAFQFTLRDGITQIENPDNGVLVFENLDKLKGQGVDFEWQSVLTNGLRGRLSYSYQDSKNDTDDKPLAAVPHNLFKANLLVPLVPDWLFLAIEENYVSDRLRPAGSHTDAYSLTNLTLSSELLDGTLELSGSVYNLLDENYAHPAGLEFRQQEIEQNGREFRVKATYHF